MYVGEAILLLNTAICLAEFQRFEPPLLTTVANNIVSLSLQVHPQHVEVRRRKRLRRLERRGRLLRREDLRLLPVHLRDLRALHPAVMGLRRGQRSVKELEINKQAKELRNWNLEES